MSHLGNHPTHDAGVTDFAHSFKVNTSNICFHCLLNNTNMKVSFFHLTFATLNMVSPPLSCIVIGI